jgi:hypothetical protein
MAQQPPQPSYQTQQGQTTSIGARFGESVPMEVQNAVADLDRLETVCEWLKDRAGERNQPRVAQRADDLSHLAHIEKQLLVRNSPFAEPVGRAVQQTVGQVIQEFQQRANDPEVQDAVAQVQQTLANLDRALGWQQQSGQIGQQPMGQVGQQPTGYQQSQGQGQVGQQPFGAQPTGGPR